MGDVAALTKNMDAKMKGRGFCDAHKPLTHLVLQNQNMTTFQTWHSYSYEAESSLMSLSSVMLHAAPACGRLLITVGDAGQRWGLVSIVVPLADGFDLWLRLKQDEEFPTFYSTA